MSAVSDNGNFPMVDEEEVTSKKLAPMAEEMIMLIEVLKRNCISPSDSHPPVVITKNMSAVIDNRKFMMVDEEDLIFKKISPMAEEILEMLRVCVAKKIKVSDFVWYNDEIMEHVEKLADGWRTTVSYFVKKAVKKYADDE
ncbi:putative ribonuclease H-like domain-containing protein [Tanacetum coccineum]